MGTKSAIEIIQELVDRETFLCLCRELAGKTVYFPSNYEWHDKSERNALLREDFYNGKYEISDLAEKYDLSISRVYKIIQHKE